MPRIRLLSRLPIDLSSKRGTLCTVAFEVQEPHGKHVVTMREAGKVGYWELHTFGAWEHGRAEDLLYRVGVDFDRGMAVRVANRLVELGAATLAD